MLQSFQSILDEKQFSKRIIICCSPHDQPLCYIQYCTEQKRQSISQIKNRHVGPVAFKISKINLLRRFLNFKAVSIEFQF